jgi:Helix-turn-helix domain
MSENRKPVAGHAARERWMRAILATDYPPATFKVAISLGLYFNCSTGRCDPGNARIAKELGVTVRSVRRAIAALEEAGWLIANRGGGSHDQKTSFTLLMAPERRTTAVPCTEDKAMSPVRGTETGTDGGQETGVRRTYAVRTYEPENLKNLKGGRPPPPRPPTPDSLIEVVVLDSLK